MEQERLALVERARGGDPTAFSALVGHYQEMVLGYALGILHDFHLAQDVTQEALLAAHRGLGTLEDAAKFPAWLRGIVRFQCGHLRRRRYLDVLPLEEAHDFALPQAGPEQHLEIAEGFHRVLAAIRALPAAQREVALLFYIKHYAQREVAAFLELPVTTVNNRLHAARTALRERLAMMSNTVGRVSAVQDVVVDVQFPADEAPLLLSDLAVAGSGGQRLQVVQCAGAGLVRCLVREGDPHLQPGLVVNGTGGPLLAPLDASLLARCLPLLVETSRQSRRRQRLETGIKVLDLLCPCPRGGTLGIFGPSGAGRMVVGAEVLHNTARDVPGVTIVAFLHGEAEARGWYDAPAEVPRPVGAGGLIGLPIANPLEASAPEVIAASAHLDARAFLSLPLGKSGLWPAIDPLLSASRLLEPAIVGREHHEVALAARRLLRAAREIVEGLPAGTSWPPSAEDSLLVARARTLQRYFTQPFAVAEAFTGRRAQVVPVATTVRDVRALLVGDYDAWPEEAFLWRGALDESDTSGKDR